MLSKNPCSVKITWLAAINGQFFIENRVILRFCLKHKIFMNLCKIYTILSFVLSHIY